MWRCVGLVATKLVLTSLMATTIIPSNRSSTPSGRSLELPFYVAELQHVYCWVCSSEETRSLESIERARKSRNVSRSRSSFVHPCSCSLVAHEKVGFCLCLTSSAFYHGCVNIISITLVFLYDAPNVKHYISWSNPSR